MRLRSHLRLSLDPRFRGECGFKFTQPALVAVQM